MKALWRSFLHLAFPTKCRHCEALLPPDETVLCPGCSSLLDLIHPEGRCSACFNPMKEEELVCQECRHDPFAYAGMGAAFEYEGPAASLVKKMKYAQQPYLAKGMAAFLVAQFDRLQWPLPDALVPIPLSWTRRLERGYNQSFLLAEAMGALLQRPVWDILKRQSGDFTPSRTHVGAEEGFICSKISN